MRVGRGLTLRLALAAEECGTVNEETWKKALAAHPEFLPLYEAGKAQFLERATERLAQSEELGNLRWLLERRHSDLFGKSAADLEVHNHVNVSLPADVLERAREFARGDRKAGKHGKG